MNTALDLAGFTWELKPVLQTARNCFIIWPG